MMMMMMMMMADDDDDDDDDQMMISRRRMEEEEEGKDDKQRQITSQLHRRGWMCWSLAEGTPAVTALAQASDREPGADNNHRG